LHPTHFPAHRVDTAPHAWQTNWFFDAFAMAGLAGEGVIRG
jgi:hypothetical protein